MLWYNLICNLQHSLLTSLNPKSCFTVHVPWLSRVPSLIIKYLCAQCLQIQNNLCSFYLKKKTLFAIKYLITCASTNAIYCTWWLPRVGKNCAWSLKCISETTKADVAGLSASRCDAANLFCSVFLFSNIKEMMIQINLCSCLFFLSLPNRVLRIWNLKLLLKLQKLRVGTLCEMFVMPTIQTLALSNKQTF